MKSATPPAYRIRQPEGDPVPVIVSIPHAGTRVPAEVRAAFASPAIAALPMTDWHVDRLYEFLPRLGVTVIQAVWSRFVVDLNRPPRPRPLYPGRFETGVIPETTFTGEPIFRQTPSPEKTAELIRQYYQPYHEALAGLLGACQARFGRAVLVDAHSVISHANRVHPALEEDIYLGDRDGDSCGPWLRGLVSAEFAGLGYAVAVNSPYKGGYITSHYGAGEGVEALQIEMAQRVYMHEDDPAGGPGHPRFRQVSADLERVFHALIRGLQTDEGPQ